MFRSAPRPTRPDFQVSPRLVSPSFRYHSLEGDALYNTFTGVKRSLIAGFPMGTRGIELLFETVERTNAFSWKRPIDIPICISTHPSLVELANSKEAIGVLSSTLHSTLK